MPIYAYQCDACGVAFDQSERMREHAQAHPRCPQCHSEHVHQVFTPFFAKTARKS